MGRSFREIFPSLRVVRETFFPNHGYGDSALILGAGRQCTRGKAGQKNPYLNEPRRHHTTRTAVP